jgi:hypothetical protein
VSVAVKQNDNKVFIQDSSVEVTVVIESCLPKQILCVQAAVSVEATKDGKRQNEMPNACPQEQPVERKQSTTGKKQQSIQSQRNTTGDTQNPKYVYFQACSIITYMHSKKKEREQRTSAPSTMLLTQ